MNKIQISLSSALSVIKGCQYILKDSKKILSILLIILINFFIFCLFIFMFFYLIGLVSNKINFNVSSDFSILLNILRIVFSFLVSIYVFNAVSLIINSPFYDNLTEKVLKEKGIIDIHPTTVFQTIVRSIFFEMKKLSLQIVILLITLLFNFIPCIGTPIFLIINFFTFIIFNGLDLYQPCLSKKDLLLLDQIRFIIKRPYSLWPNIIVGGTLCAIPFVNIIFMPIAITGSIINYTEHLED